jgi:hypothetical protein
MVAGEVAGSGVGGAAGSYMKDAINNYVFGDKKSLSDANSDALSEGATDAALTGA